MKTLSQTFTEESLLKNILRMPYDGYECPRIKKINPNTISKSVIDRDLLRTAFVVGDVLRMTPKEIDRNFYSRSIWLFTTSGKILDLQDSHHDEVEGYVEFEIDAFRYDKLLYANLLIKDDEVVNVFYSEPEWIGKESRAKVLTDNKPLEKEYAHQEPEMMPENIDEDLRWLTE